MTFNILVGNTDDHARNHAAFWDGEMLDLTPAYDIAPQKRGTAQANQALNITPGKTQAQLTSALQAAPQFHIEPVDPGAIIDGQIDAIRSDWLEVCELAGMQKTERAYFAGRQVFNPYAFEGYGPVPTLPDT